MARTPRGFSSVSNAYREAYEEGPEALRRFQAKERARSGDAAVRALNKREADRRAEMPAPKKVAKKKVAAKAKKKPTTFKQRMKARGLAAVTREELAAWEKQTGKKGLRAYLNAKGKRPTKATPTATATARKGNAVPAARSGDRTPTVKAPINTTVQRRTTPTTTTRRGNANAVPGRRGVKPPTVKAPINTALKRRTTPEKAKVKRLQAAAATKRATEERIRAGQQKLADARTASQERIADVSGPPRRGFLSPPQRLGEDTGTSQVIDKYVGETAGERGGTVAGLAAGAGTGAGVVRGISVAARNAAARKAAARKAAREAARKAAELEAARTGQITRGEFRGGPSVTLKKGGLVKKSAAKKSVAKKPSRKKSIDGLARKGKTRAKHR
tara:strand:+ start:713 stop:1873 length:1161 start_codon:yes stop_codon:yes gene_type:complete